MNIDRINEFLVLAKCLNYSKTAKQLYLTQSVLSRHINDLEEKIGAPLLIRNTHKVKLTQVGELFAQEAEKIVSQYDESMKKVRAASAAYNKVLNIGYMEAAVKPFLKEAVENFSEAYPNITLELQAYHLDELIKALDEDRIDIAFATHVNESSFPGISSKHVLRDDLYVVMNKKHPLATRGEIDIMELSDEPLINLSQKQNPVACEFHIKMFNEHHAKYRMVKEAPNVETALFYVTLNKGIYIIPGHLSSLITDQAFVKIANEDCYIDLNLLWKNDNSNTAVQIFKKNFFQFFK